MVLKERLKIPSTSPEIEGHLGSMLRNCIKNGVMAVNYSLYIDAFSKKMDSEGSFCGEFWGKWFTSAVLAYEYDPTDEHYRILKCAVDGLLSVQETNGRISCSASDFTTWDLWGRKYVLLGLLAFFDITKDKSILDCASKMLDNIIDVTRDAGVKITETGLTLLQGLSSCSILQPVVLIYERTGNKRYLEFAKYLIGLWEEPSEYNPNGLRLISDSIAGKLPVNIAVPKGYEIMSCFEGLCELYRITGEEEYINAVLAYMDLVLEREIMIVGSGSVGELWCDGAFRQTQLLETPMETCVTATFMKICRQLLMVTGDKKWADQLEISLFNALAGAMEKDGSWWAYFSPLQGCRIPSRFQIEAMQSSCCVLNGPRALLEVPKWALLENNKGISINLYQTGVYHASWNNYEIKLKQDTAYPYDSNISIKLENTPETEYTIFLRVPEWSKKTIIRVNGHEVGNVQKATYTELTRVWSAGDEIQLELDIYPRIIKAPGNHVYHALMSGPVVLGMSERYIKEKPQSLWLLDSNEKKVRDEQTKVFYYINRGINEESGNPIAEKYELPETLAAYKIRFAEKPVHFFGHKEFDLILCDFASLTESLYDKTPFRVWFPQPLFLNDIFPKNSQNIISGAVVDIDNELLLAKEE